MAEVGRSEVAEVGRAEAPEVGRAKVTGVGFLGGWVNMAAVLGVGFLREGGVVVKGKRGQK